MNVVWINLISRIYVGKLYFLQNHRRDTNIYQLNVSSQCCPPALVRIRHKNHLLSVKKTSFLDLKSIFWSPWTQLETSQGRYSAVSVFRLTVIFSLNQPCSFGISQIIILLMKSAFLMISRIHYLQVTSTSLYVLVVLVFTSSARWCCNVWPCAPSGRCCKWEIISC